MVGYELNFLLLNVLALSKSQKEDSHKDNVLTRLLLTVKAIPIVLIMVPTIVNLTFEWSAGSGRDIKPGNPILLSQPTDSKHRPGLCKRGRWQKIFLDNHTVKNQQVYLFNKITYSCSDQTNQNRTLKINLNVC